MIKLNNDCLKSVLSFVYDWNKSCLLDMENEDIKHYLSILKTSKRFLFIRKRCHTIFCYYPCNNLVLRPIRECSIHCDKYHNKLSIIYTMNRFKNNIFKKREENLYEIKFDDEMDAKFCLPYIKDYCQVAYISEDRKSIFVLSKNSRYPSIFI